MVMDQSLLYRIVPKSAYLMLKGEKFPLEGGGRVKNHLCTVYIARAILILHKGKLGEIYNAGVDEPISMREIVEKVAKYLNKEFDGLFSLQRVELVKMRNIG